MIQMQTMLRVADNTGAKMVMCIKVLGGSGKCIGKVGSRLVVTVKDAIPFGKVKRGDVLKAVVVRTKKIIRRTDGSIIRFDDNAVVLITDQDQLIGTRVFGPIAREIKYSKYTKITSLALEVL